MIEKAAKLQNTFHNKLTTYINNGIFCRSDLLLSCIVPDLYFARHSKKLFHEYKKFSDEISVMTNSKLKVNIEPYKAQNKHVRQMKMFVNKYLQDDLIGAYVHGSLGTYEEIEYSDFDALVILKNDIFSSPKKLAKTANILNRASSIMFDFDPFAHHGWFVLTEADLKLYCNAYFPYELFTYAKSLFDDKGRELELSLRNSIFEIQKAFDNMTDSILNKIRNQNYPWNMFQLKNLLSGFMLLPSLYIQSRYSKGIYKKESFNIASKDFNSADWAIMDEVSQIRADWSCETSSLLKKIIIRPHLVSRHIAQRFAPKIPANISSLLTQDFYFRMQKLVSLMKDNLL